MTSASPFWSPARHQDRRPFLLARAKIVAAIRAWFAGQGFLEVEPSYLVQSPGAETHIEAVAAGAGYLHTSPEFAMKKLLAAGEEKIFFLGKTWRVGETGPLHAPEFTMLEWYRAGAPYEQAMEDCAAILGAAARAIGATALAWKDKIADPFAPSQRLTVAEVFRARAGVDVLGGGFEAAGVRVGADDSWSDLFSRVLVEKIEPDLGVGAPAFLIEYPIQEAALARPSSHDPSVAERFELYACGVELANGYGELTDPAEQRRRLIAAMDEKEKRYGTRWPLDEDFLAALAHMPPASGVALGVDRLAMLLTGARSIADVLWTPSEDNAL